MTHDVELRPELLSPAGDAECLQAAIANGADAVYFGLDHGFNARARAGNFPLESLPETMTLLHRHGVRGYVTLNTLAFTDELPVMAETIAAIARASVDAVLVQDLGVARMVKAICPELELHASTQMTLSCAETIEAARTLGLSRVVLARELSLEEIRKIRAATNMPLEVFVHGALCVAYSGQCLTSESLGGRSANRGQCAQACRLPYDLICDGKDVELGAVRYLLSPQDLAAYALIPELIDAGVCSFKIEGRLKTPEYVANITRHYRQAIDAALAGKPKRFTPEEIREMELSFSRGFSPGWLEGNDHKRLVPGLSSAKRGVEAGEVLQISGRRVRVRSSIPLQAGDGVVFEGDRTAGAEPGGRIFKLERQGRLCEGEVPAGIVDLLFAAESLDPRQIEVGSTFWKTDDPRLSKRWRKTYQDGRHERKLPLDVRAEIRVGQPLRLEMWIHGIPVGSVTEDFLPPIAEKHRLDREDLQRQLGRLGNTSLELAQLDVVIEGDPMVPLSVMGSLRRKMVETVLDNLEHAPERSIRTDWQAHLGSVPPLGTLPVTRRTAELERVESATTSDEALVASAWQVSEPDPSPAAASAPREILKTSAPEIVTLCRTLEQLQEALAAGITDLEADFQDIGEYREAVAMTREAPVRLWLAPTRILKPGEFGLVRKVARYGAHGILARNLAHIAFCRDEGIPFITDFSLNATNELTVEALLGWGAQWVTPSYDLDRDQLKRLVDRVDATRLEAVVFQHMPMFHMEHCVFCSLLSPGTNKTNCGRPCDRHQVKLRDRVGMEHPLKADVGCRNTLFNAVPQSAAEVVHDLLRRGVRRFRVEFLETDRKATRRIIDVHRRLIAGSITGTEVWQSLQAANRVGVTRGTLETRKNPLAIL